MCLALRKTMAKIVTSVGGICIVIAVFMMITGMDPDFIDMITNLLGPDLVRFFVFTKIAGIGVGIWILGIGIVMVTVGGSLSKMGAKKGTKEKIANFANPILNSKGKVSLRQIADYTKWDIETAIERNALESVIKEMIGVGYFEGARFEGGWLIKDVSPCPYCSEPVRLTDKKCPNCGAVIKK